MVLINRCWGWRAPWTPGPHSPGSTSATSSSSLRWPAMAAIRSSTLRPRGPMPMMVTLIRFIADRSSWPRRLPMIRKRPARRVVDAQLRGILAASAGSVKLRHDRRHFQAAIGVVGQRDAGAVLFGDVAGDEIGRAHV